MNIKKNVFDLYKTLLEEGIGEESYYHLIEIMDNLEINRDNFEVRIFNGKVKFKYMTDGYEVDCD